MTTYDATAAAYDAIAALHALAARGALTHRAAYDGVDAALCGLGDDAVLAIAAAFIGRRLTTRLSAVGLIRHKVLHTLMHGGAGKKL